LEPSSTANDGLDDQKSAADGVISLADQQVQQLVTHWIKGKFLDFCVG